MLLVLTHALELACNCKQLVYKRTISLFVLFWDYRRSISFIPILAEKPVIPHFWQFLSLITSLFQVKTVQWCLYPSGNLKGGYHNEVGAPKMGLNEALWPLS